MIYSFIIQCFLYSNDKDETRPMYIRGKLDQFAHSEFKKFIHHVNNFFIYDEDLLIKDNILEVDVDKRFHDSSFQHDQDIYNFHIELSNINMDYRQDDPHRVTFESHRDEQKWWVHHVTVNDDTFLSYKDVEWFIEDIVKGRVEYPIS